MNSAPPLFHLYLYALDYGWHIHRYDVPYAFIRSEAACTIFGYPPKGQMDFPGQILKLSKMLYGSKQAAALWYSLLNDFLHKLGFIASPMDPCCYRRQCSPGSDPTGPRSDATIILHVDDMRVATHPDALQDFHDELFQEFQCQNLGTSNRTPAHTIDTIEYTIGVGSKEI